MQNQFLSDNNQQEKMQLTAKKFSLYWNIQTKQAQIVWRANPRSSVLFKMNAQVPYSLLLIHEYDFSNINYMSKIVH